VILSGVIEMKRTLEIGRVARRQLSGGDINQKYQPLGIITPSFRRCSFLDGAESAITPRAAVCECWRELSNGICRPAKDRIIIIETLRREYQSEKR
jgi:hypothetical protein